MEHKEFIKDWLISTVTPMVQYPDDLRIEVKQDEMGVLYTLSCNSSDNGKVIGRSGTTAQAIRHLLKVVGMPRNIRATLKINAPGFETQTAS